MPLWGQRDLLADVPKQFLAAKDEGAISVGDLKIDRSSLPEGTRIIFVSLEEAQTTEAKANGMGVPGWYTYFTYGLSGATGSRVKVELIAEASISAAAAGDVGIDAGAGAVTDDDILTGKMLYFTTQNTDIDVLFNGTATFAPVVVSDPADGGITYQWEEKNLGTGAWANIVLGVGDSGDTTSTLAIATAAHADEGRTFRLKATLAAAQNSPIYSDEASISNVEAVITITGQPVDFEYVDDNTDATFTVAATISDNADLTYQWYEDGVGAIEGETAVTLTFPVTVADVDRTFYCIVSGSDAADEQSDSVSIVNLV